MILWRRREENPWVHEAEIRVSKILQTLSRFDRGDGVWAPSRAWFVKARNPAQLAPDGSRVQS